MRVLLITKEFISVRLNIANASKGLVTMGRPFGLKLVFTKAATPYFDPKHLSSSKNSGLSYSKHT